MCDRHDSTHTYVHRVGYTHDPADPNHHINPDGHDAGCYFYTHESNIDYDAHRDAKPDSHGLRDAVADIDINTATGHTYVDTANP